MASQIASRVSMAYGLSEKLRIAKRAGSGHEHPFEILRGREVVGSGFTREGLFVFLDLEGRELLALPVDELARAKKK